MVFKIWKHQEVKFRGVIFSVTRSVKPAHILFFTRKKARGMMILIQKAWSIIRTCFSFSTSHSQHQAQTREGQIKIRNQNGGNILLFLFINMQLTCSSFNRLYVIFEQGAIKQFSLSKKEAEERMTQYVVPVHILCVKYCQAVNI